MSSMSNREIARKLWDATSRGDAEGIESVISPDGVWNSLSSGVLAGTYKGHEEIIGMLARSGELVDAMQVELLDILVSEIGAVIHYHVLATKGDRSLDTRQILHMRIEGDQIYEISSLPMKARDAESFWAES
jgi:ketosteroid isomerase-like protein